MNIKHNGYWFYLEPYVYVSHKDNQALLLSMLDWKEVIVTNNKVLELINQILNLSSGGVVYLSAIEYQELITELDLLRNLFFCEVIPVNLTEAKPIQITPQINIIKENLCKSKVFYRSRRELHLLVTEVNLFLSTVCSTNSKCVNCEQYQTQIPCCINSTGTYSLTTLVTILQRLFNLDIKSINLLGMQSLSHDDQKKNFQLVNKSGKKYCVIINACSNFLPDLDEMNANGECKIIIDISSIPYEQIKEYFDKVAKYLSIKVIFLVSEEQNYFTIKQLVNLYPSFQYLKIPFFNGSNYLFYEELISLQNNIYIANKTIKKITLNKLLNTNYWGKLYIEPNGNVSSKLGSECLGNILSNSIKNIVFKELMDKNSTWLYIRSNSKCIKCIFQYICPPPFVNEIRDINKICPKDIMKHCLYI